jgi:hypothetical protein
LISKREGKDERLKRQKGEEKKKEERQDRKDGGKDTLVGVGVW